MNKCLKYTCFHGPGTNVIESNTSNRSNRLQSNSNSNRLKILNCNSNSYRLQSNSNRLLVIDPIPDQNHLSL